MQLEKYLYLYLQNYAADFVVDWLVSKKYRVLLTKNMVNRLIYVGLQNNKSISKSSLINFWLQHKRFFSGSSAKE